MSTSSRCASLLAAQRRRIGSARKGTAARTGCVRYEARLIRDAFYRDQHGLDRFVPLVLPGSVGEDELDVDALPGVKLPCGRTPEAAETTSRWCLPRRWAHSKNQIGRASCREGV